MGAESTSSCTWVKHLADLLRDKASSQQYSSIYEDRRTKSIEDTEKKDSKGVASGQKGPWDQCGDQGDCSPRPTGHSAGLLGESQINSSINSAPSPAKQGLSSTKRDQCIWAV